MSYIQFVLSLGVSISLGSEILHRVIFCGGFLLGTLSFSLESLEA